MKILPVMHYFLNGTPLVALAAKIVPTVRNRTHFLWQLPVAFAKENVSLISKGIHVKLVIPDVSYRICSL